MGGGKSCNDSESLRFGQDDNGSQANCDYSQNRAGRGHQAVEHVPLDMPNGLLRTAAKDQRQYTGGKCGHERDHV